MFLLIPHIASVYPILFSSCQVLSFIYIGVLLGVRYLEFLGITPFFFLFLRPWPFLFQMGSLRVGMYYISGVLGVAVLACGDGSSAFFLSFFVV